MAKHAIEYPVDAFADEQRDVPVKETPVRIAAVAATPPLSPYESKIAAQIAQFKDGFEGILALPEIFHYWSNKYLRPRLNQVFDVDTIGDFFAGPLARLNDKGPASEISVLSIGSGDCSIDIATAQALKNQGLDHFKITATELSPVLAAHSRKAIADAGLSAYIECIEVDLNSWTCEPASYDGAFASQSLHHIENLEHLFANLKSALKPGAVLAVSDMIGRNGHMRWPEALEALDTFWAMLPESHKTNRLMKRVEDRYINHDCSTQGFEGVRAQDILPQLLTHFFPGKFLAAGGLIDVFIDRAFGHNFDPAIPFDRGFIDAVQYTNDLLLNQHLITPTMLMAYFHTEPTETVCWQNVTPEWSVRWPYTKRHTLRSVG